MSQQRILIAMCLICGVVAMTNAQIFNGSNCSKKVRSVLVEYQKSVTSNIQDYLSKVSSQAGDTADLSKYSDDIDKITKEVQGLTNLSGNLDFNNIVTSIGRIIQLQTSLTMKAVRPGQLTQAATAGTELLSKQMAANANLLKAIDCLESSS